MRKPRAKQTHYTNEEQMTIARLIGWFKSTHEIQKHIKSEYGKVIVPSTVHKLKHAPEWAPIIEKYRDEYTKTIFNVPLANKKKRLDELQDQYEHFKALGDLKTCRDIIREFREETEKRFGDVNLSFTQINEYNSLSDEELAQERMRTIEQLEKVKKMRLLTMRSQDELEVEPQSA